jgi:tRNA G18 (ribose-2'-O)-methylase SpoU
MSEPHGPQSADDPRLRDYTRLTDVELRRRREPEEGLFIAEGEKVVRRALRAGYRMRSLLLTPKWAGVMSDVIDAATAPVYVVPPDLAEQVTGYHVHRGALASMARKPLPAAGDLLRTARRAAASDAGDDRNSADQRVAIFEGLVDHANLGAAFRSAAALGVRAILLSPDCADPFYRRAIKVSMGSVFSVPYARFADWPRGLDDVRDAGYGILAMTPDEEATSLDELNPDRFGRSAIMFGSEGHGLSSATLRAADESVRVPMAAGVDSLNVAAASAVVFYATRPKPT